MTCARSLTRSSSRTTPSAWPKRRRWPSKRWWRWPRSPPKHLPTDFFNHEKEARMSTLDQDTLATMTDEERAAIEDDDGYTDEERAALKTIDGDALPEDDDDGDEEDDTRTRHTSTPHYAQPDKPKPPPTAPTQ